MTNFEAITKLIAAHGADPLATSQPEAFDGAAAFTWARTLHSLMGAIGCDEVTLMKNQANGGFGHVYMLITIGLIGVSVNFENHDNEVIGVHVLPICSPLATLVAALAIMPEADGV